MKFLELLKGGHDVVDTDAAKVAWFGRNDGAHL